MRAITPTPVVLIVEDEALIRWALAEGLGEAGYTVEQAATGAEARAGLARATGGPAVVLLDLRLPDVANLSLLMEIRRTHPASAVIMMTAHLAPEDAELARAAGVFAVVSKPFDVTQMVRLVGEASGRHAGHRRSPPAAPVPRSRSA